MNFERPTVRIADGFDTFDLTVDLRAYAHQGINGLRLRINDLFLVVFRSTRMKCSKGREMAPPLKRGESVMKWELGEC
ncbi:hypothetical protein ACQUSR_33770 [Streptomyces sp. P1-3]|uniref:hypothetical protein n=1 Tax=Streptomyces sp. P1-3 TaxID=3421658 RepID=UPI003D36C3E6